jgi:hypothetical protein
MVFHPQAGIINEDDGRESRRRTGRVALEAVVCELGTVRDLSATGMRVITRRPPKGAFTLHVRGLDSEVEIDGRVAWAKRIGLFRFEVGVKFINVSEDQAQKLTRMGMTNRRRTMM